MVLPSQRLENSLRAKGARFPAGVDEVGRGAWAGPLLTAAVILPERPRLRGIRDSKLLSTAARERLYVRITDTAVAWGVALVTVEFIDAYGVGVANRMATQAAIGRLAITPDHVITDGRSSFGIAVPTTSLVDADARVYCVAAASIIAKVTRDRLMATLEHELPGYGFARHRGYGTPLHQQAIRRYGMTPIHRRSFVPPTVVGKNARPPTAVVY